MYLSLQVIIRKYSNNKVALKLTPGSFLYACLREIGQRTSFLPQGTVLRVGGIF